MYFVEWDPYLYLEDPEIYDIYYKSWIPKLVDACYNDIYSFSKHTAMTHGNFLYLIGMIWTNKFMCQKIICTCQYACHNTRHMAYN